MKGAAGVACSIVDLPICVWQSVLLGTMPCQGCAQQLLLVSCVACFPVYLSFCAIGCAGLHAEPVLIPVDI
jgi:hypothetical protein